MSDDPKKDGYLMPMREILALLRPTADDRPPRRRGRGRAAVSGGRCGAGAAREAARTAHTSAPPRS